MIFISYSTKDKAFVAELEKSFKDIGVKYWLDKRAIRVGANISFEIYTGLSDSSFMVYIISRHSLKSEWCKEELSMARVKEKMRKGFVILPVLVDNIELPLYLQHVHCLDMRQWQKPKTFRKAFSKLIDAISYSTFRVLFTHRNLREPAGIASDGHHIYVADVTGTVCKYDSNGKCVAVLKGLTRPHGIALDQKRHRVLIADTYADRVLTCNEDLGHVETLISSEYVRHPHALAVSSRGQIYIANTDLHAISMFDAKGTLKASVGSAFGIPSRGRGLFNTPCGVCVDNEHVFVADTFNDDVQILDLSLTPIRHLRREGIKKPCAAPVSVCRTGNILFVANEKQSPKLQIWSIDNSTNRVHTKLLQEQLAGHLLVSAFGIATKQASLFISDRGAAKIVIADLRHLSKY